MFVFFPQPKSNPYASICAVREARLKQISLGFLYLNSPIIILHSNASSHRYAPVNQPRSISCIPIGEAEVRQTDRQNDTQTES